VTATAKDNILEVFLRIGGVPEMAKWARKNRGDFYGKIYARLIPKDVTLGADAGLEELLTQLHDRHSSRDIPIVDGDYTEIDNAQG
jgi:hypothetical protein